MAVDSLILSVSNTLGKEVFTQNCAFSTLEFFNN